MVSKAIENQNSNEYDKLCQEYMTLLYQGLSGFISYQPGEKEAGEKNNVYLTYGEILYPSMNKVIEYLDFNEDDVFYDLGSGIGKVGLHIFLKTPVRKSWGIEAAEKRNVHAAKVYAQVKQEFPDLFESGRRELGCQVGNFLHPGTGIEEATVVYTCSTCFSEGLLKDIGTLLDTCPKLRHLVTMKPIPCSVPFDTILEIECTWDKTKCHVYSRK